MDKYELSLIQKADKVVQKYLKIIQLCNLYRLHNENPESILKMICDIIYSENEETMTIKDIKGE